MPDPSGKDKRGARGGAGGGGGARLWALLGALAFAAALVLVYRQQAGSSGGGARPILAGGSLPVCKDLAEPKLSSMQCDGNEEWERVCTFENLLLHNGVFYYVAGATGDLPTLPVVQVSWKDDAALLGGQLRVVRAGQLPFSWAGTAHQCVKDALLWFRSDDPNSLHHSLGEHAATMHRLLCERLGRCSWHPDSLDSLQIFWTEAAGTWAVDARSAVNEVWSCLSAHQPLHVADVALSGRVVAVSRAVAGVGPTCGAPHFCSQGKRQPLHKDVYRAWRGRLLECLRLPETPAVATSPPALTIVARRWEAARTFLNLQDVVHHLQQNAGLKIEVAMLEGLTLSHQAAVFQRTSILLASYGMALGHLIFMPVSAVVIQIMPYQWGGKHHFFSEYAAYLKDVNDLQLLGYDAGAGDTLLRRSRLLADPAFAELAPAQQAALFDKGECPKADSGPWADPAHVEATCVTRWFLHASDVVVDLAKLDPLLATAVARIGEVRKANLAVIEGWLRTVNAPAAPDAESNSTSIRRARLL